jgi:uncharacterized protein
MNRTVAPIRNVRKEAENGDVDAQYELATNLLTDRAGSKRKEDGLKWLQRAADRGHPEALCDLGVHYHYGDGVSRDLSKSFSLYLAGAKNGSSHAQYHVGLCYAHGEGVRKNSRQAFGWFLKAARAGHAWARVNVGTAYRDGKGVRRDYPAALVWYRRAARQGEVIAQREIGAAYHDGVGGLSRDFRRAVVWYRRASAGGDAYAQYCLGLALLYGEGVRPDLNKAQYWLTRAKLEGVQGASEALSAVRRRQKVSVSEARSHNARSG